jgi:hypothetical protein
MYKQTRTPLYDAFFSEFNYNTIQNGIITETRIKTGKSINKQDSRPLTIIMESVYSVNAYNPYGNIQAQVESMNKQVIQECTRQTVMGIGAYMRYIQDIKTPPQPMQNPTMISSYGEKIPFNTKIGL